MINIISTSKNKIEIQSFNCYTEYKNKKKVKLLSHGESLLSNDILIFFKRNILKRYNK